MTSLKSPIILLEIQTRGENMKKVKNVKGVKEARISEL